MSLSCRMRMRRCTRGTSAPRPSRTTSTRPSCPKSCRWVSWPEGAWPTCCAKGLRFLSGSRGEQRLPTSSLDGCSRALLLPRSRTLGVQGGQSTRTWWTRIPPPSTLPGARRVRRTPSSSSRKQRVYGMSLRDPRPRSEKPLKGAGRKAWRG